MKTIGKGPLAVARFGLLLCALGLSCDCPREAYLHYNRAHDCVEPSTYSACTKSEASLYLVRCSVSAEGELYLGGDLLIPGMTECSADQYSLIASAHAARRTCDTVAAPLE